jgi:dTDP-4-dehydrorhamnose reductase
VPMKTILVTGSNGLLGQKITEKIIAEGGYQLIATSKGENRFPIKKGYVYEEMDILNSDQVAQVIEKYRPDSIIHTAALTNVDTCHVQQELAFELNVMAVANLISICEQYQIHLIYLSTDFVFDGKEGPYDENAIPNPVSYYGETKLMAEKLVQQSKCAWTILRTILVYGIISDASRSNIVLWAKEALAKGNPINVVNDQFRMPTLAEDLADACLLSAEGKAHGVYHISGKEMMSIAEIVRHVADFWNLDQSLIKEVSSSTLNQEAKRPLKTGFILTKAMAVLNYQPRSFGEGLVMVSEQLISSGRL